VVLEAVDAPSVIASPSTASVHAHLATHAAAQERVGVHSPTTITLKVSLHLNPKTETVPPGVRVEEDALIIPAIAARRSSQPTIG
jgi:hypothetical protein